MSLCHILSLCARAPIWKMVRKKVNIFSMKKEYYQFQVACLSYMNLKNNKAFKEQVDKCLPNQFDVTTSKHIMKTPKQYHTRVIDLIIFYNDSKSLIFNELGVFVHFFIEKYVHVDYLSF